MPRGCQAGCDGSPVLPALASGFPSAFAPAVPGPCRNPKSKSPLASGSFKSISPISRSLSPLYFCPSHPHPGGISCRGGDRAWHSRYRRPPLPASPLAFPPCRCCSGHRTPFPRARPLAPSARSSSAIAEEARSLSFAVRAPSALQRTPTRPLMCAVTLVGFRSPLGRLAEPQQPLPA